MAQCTATSKRSGERCRNRPAIGRTLCHIHGGKTPVGIAAPQTVTGRYSKHLPTRMLATYEASKADPELLALRDEIGLLDARLVDLLKRVDTGESGATWRALQAEYRAYREALAKADVPEMSARLKAIGSLITQGVADEAAWVDVRATVEHRRRLVESERKRLVDMQQMVTGEQAALLVRSLMQAIRDHVHDRDVLARITADLARVAPVA